MLTCPRFVGEPPVIWLNLSGAFVVGLDRACTIHTVACLDHGQEFPLVSARSGVRFLSRERLTKRRLRTPDPCTDEIVPALRPALERAVVSLGRDRAMLVCPRGAATLERFAEEVGTRRASPPEALYRWLNHKANFFSGLETLHLPRLRGRWGAIDEARFADLAGRLGVPFVLQRARGQSGSGTFMVGTASELAAVQRKLAGEDVWAAPFAGDLSLNVNAMAMESAVGVAFPSVQLVGLEMLGVRPCAYCGNDFSSATRLPAELLAQVQEQTERVGGWLSGLGFRGLFGLDFVVDETSGRPIAVDLNPRWQGSTVLEAQGMLRAGRFPLAAAELAYVCGAAGESELIPLLGGWREPIEGAQLHLHFTGKSEMAVDREVRPGIYASCDDLAYLRPGLELDDLHGDEVLLGGAVVAAGTRIAPGARPARLSSLRGVLDPGSWKPSPWAFQAVDRLYRVLGVPPPSAVAVEG
jgi:hypothetical protein